MLFFVLTLKLMALINTQHMDMKQSHLSYSIPPTSEILTEWPFLEHTF